ncbi:MAG: TolC family protein [Chitinophagaceae bacterium]|nr:TolC family protein [Chitinophagaceae bacterium]
MNKKKMTWLLTVTVLFVGRHLNGQDIIRKHIDQAFENNLVLKEKMISLEKSLIALKEAQSFFLPVASFDAQYLLAEGGRTIDIPVGTLMNPVYSTLNQLTNSDKFPKIGNVSEPLNPNNFYDVRIKTVMPIINPDIRINRDSKKQQISLQQYELDIYKRELVKEVKLAYFNYLTATRAIDIYRSTLDVVHQNLKVNRSLLQNGKGLPAYVSRAESEVSKVEIQLQNAVNDQKNARSYFNFLLNKPLGEEIVSSSEEFVLEKYADTVANIYEREELKSLSLVSKINNNVLKMNRAFRTPRLNAFLDLGSQGFDFNVNNKSLFYLAGLQLKVPIFTGKANLYKIEQTKLDARSIALKNDNTIQQLALAASVSRNNINNAYNAWLSLLKQEESAKKYFQLINRGFQEGINSFIEFLDARNQLTTVQLQLNIQKYKVMTALADYERQTASYSLK